MNIQTPFQRMGAQLTSDNMKLWERLCISEKLLYTYMIECDTSLSSLLLGVLTAYVVNLISSLVTLKITGLFMFGTYLVNMICALIVLFILIRFYRLHVCLDRQRGENALSVQINLDFEFLQGQQQFITRNIKSLIRLAVVLFIALALCFANANGLPDPIHMVSEWGKKVWEELLKQKK